mgnify:CR=1 FL=1
MLPSELFSEILIFLPERELLHKGTVNRELQAWIEHPFILRKYGILGVFKSDILYSRENWTEELIQYNDRLFQKDDQRIWNWTGFSNFKR